MVSIRPATNTQCYSTTGVGVTERYDMGFLKNLFGGGTAKPEKRYYTFQVKCNRCGEIIEGRVDLDNDLSLEYEDDRNVYFGRKVLMGDSGRCFQQVEVEMQFNSARELIEQQIQGGTFVE
ncbi:MAG TPA: hypothetical protein VFZ43_01395 [Anaerolineales bacterium]